MFTRIAWAALLLAWPADGAVLGRRHGASNVTLRKRLHVNDLITETGTVEIDLGSLYSYTGQTFTAPLALKYTPGGQTEFSVGFDSMSGAITPAATMVVLDTAHIDIAIAPQATFFLHDESGARLGATVILRHDLGLTSLGATASYSVATAASDNNPAGTWDFGGGLGRHLAASGVLGRFTPHLNAVYEKSTGFERTVSIFGGVEYQVTERVGLDFSGQRLGLIGGAPDRQFLVSLTVNLGKSHPLQQH